MAKEFSDRRSGAAPLPYFLSGTSLTLAGQGNHRPDNHAQLFLLIIIIIIIMHHPHHHQHKLTNFREQSLMPCKQKKKKVLSLFTVPCISYWQAGLGIVHSCSVLWYCSIISFLFWRKFRYGPLFCPATSPRFWSFLRGGSGRGTPPSPQCGAGNPPLPTVRGGAGNPPSPRGGFPAGRGVHPCQTALRWSCFFVLQLLAAQ